jgi:hypothetical protein
VIADGETLGENSMWWIPALVAIVVAAHHRWMVVARGQTSWKGGGFAMFSDATENDLQTSIAYPTVGETAFAEVTGLKDLTRVVALAVPTEKAIRAWAQQVLRTDWLAQQGVAVPCHPRLAASKVKAATVSVTHRRVCFDATSGGYRARVIRTVTLEALPAAEGGR